MVRIGKRQEVKQLQWLDSCGGQLYRSKVSSEFGSRVRDSEELDLSVGASINYDKVGQAWTKYPLIKYKYTILNLKIERETRRCFLARCNRAVGGILSPTQRKTRTPKPLQ